MASISSLLQNVQLHLKSRFNVAPLIGLELEFYLKPQKDSFDGAYTNFQSRAAANGLHVVKEKGQNQYEIDILQNGSILDLLNQLKSAKDILVNVAAMEKLDIIFDAKPFCDDYGSALHVHVSLHDDNGQNVYGTHAMGKEYLHSSIFGVLELLDQGIALFCHDRDFARFVPGMMCPTNISWGGNNRTTAIRIPISDDTRRRFEFRVAPSSADVKDVVAFLLIGIYHGFTNPHLSFPKIYGNAFDEQYALQILPKDLKMASKLFNTKQTLKKYIDFFANQY
ncbi:type I glutamate--ammonia ligase [Rickettsiales endosymbiont of Peranema trichophorum]|uniref:hypothetical protein n=1 Tax=Rickettsiales endosymbiont of Peranema trichophorum TaxID=2486577 RepID=UPI001A91D674|nr:hypothetical protein [Rickettsiales endosymbiont of Peranema trichophorum]